MLFDLNTTDESELIHQLRIYEIFENNKDAFHKRFREHASRIMKSYGFNIVATWETKNSSRTEFLYLLSWPDEKTMLHAWEQFRANAEWLQIKRETNSKYGDLVGEIQEKVLHPVSQDMFVLQAKA